MNSLPSVSKLMIVLLSMHLLISTTQPSTSVSVASATAISKESFVVKKTTVQSPNEPSDWAVTTGQSSIPAPSVLKTLTETVVEQLSEQASFASWKNSELGYFPLGPGTHSWLVTVSMNQQELGYLIFTAEDSDTQAYILSEYGRSPSVPYDLTSLHQTLMQSDIISSSSKYAYPTNIEPLYAPLLPLWKISFGNYETLYLNALTMDVLPWDESHLKKLNLQTSMLDTAHFTEQDYSFTSAAAVARQGERDPLANLMWITTPRLSLLSDDDIVNYINNDNNLIFTAPYHNDDVGGPFAVSGFQKWTSSKATPQQTIYVGTGLSGQRYLPLSLLRSKGEFRAFPELTE
ncbi:hypothetical protein ACP8HI_03885 [Paenibacillus sp. FA6]|uniref:hypothetical protein n=1 Tax=Paenibacillus sp. FA6 TaxID=3413029 RepID=UPI003F65D43F